MAGSTAGVEAMEVGALMLLIVVAVGCVLERCREGAKADVWAV